MKMHLLAAATAAIVTVYGSGFAGAAGMLAGKNGMTLYTYDKDKGTTPACYGLCAAFWPPYMAEAGAKPHKGWTLVKRSNGKMQWAYDGHPLYFFKSDKKKGDAKGDGYDGIWHVVKS